MFARCSARLSGVHDGEARSSPLPCRVPGQRGLRAHLRTRLRCRPRARRHRVGRGNPRLGFPRSVGHTPRWFGWRGGRSPRQRLRPVRRLARLRGDPARRGARPRALVADRLQRPHEERARGLARGAQDAGGDRLRLRCDRRAGDGAAHGGGADRRARPAAAHALAGDGAAASRAGAHGGVDWLRRRILAVPAGGLRGTARLVGAALARRSPSRERQGARGTHRGP